jgi:hypothetical protein
VRPHKYARMNIDEVDIVGSIEVEEEVAIKEELLFRQ